MMADICAGTLSTRAGHACLSIPFAGRRLETADLGDVIALHHIVRQTVGRDLLCFETDAFFADHVDRKGRILGLFAEDRLIAYGVLGLPGPQDPNFGSDLGLSADAQENVAHLDGASIAPEWQGNALHRRLIAWRLDEARATGRTIALSTAAPGNLPSLNNLLPEGLTIRAIRSKFGGTRYILRRDLDRARPDVPSGGSWIATDDLPAQEKALEDGQIGWMLSKDKSKVWFGAFGPTNEETCKGG
jgi:hypothetical protein